MCPKDQWCCIVGSCRVCWQKCIKYQTMIMISIIGYSLNKWVQCKQRRWKMSRMHWFLDDDDDEGLNVTISQTFFLSNKSKLHTRFKCYDERHWDISVWFIKTFQRRYNLTLTSKHSTPCLSWLCIRTNRIEMLGKSYQKITNYRFGAFR